jgi:hypothetical protein
MGAALAEVSGPRGFRPVGPVVQFRRDPLTLLTRVARESRFTLYGLRFILVTVYG